MGRSLVRAFLLVSLVLSLSLALSSQTEDPKEKDKAEDVKDPVLDELQKKVDRLTLEQKISELNAKIQSDKLGTTITALEGKITTDDKVLIEVQHLAYNALRHNAKDIVDRILAAVPPSVACPNPANPDACLDPKRLIIVFHDGPTVALAAQYRTARLQLMAQTRGLCRAAEAVKRPTVPPEKPFDAGIHLFVAPGFALSTATNLASSFATLLSLFRTDTDIKGIDITIDDAALQDEVANRLLQNSVTNRPVTVYRPAVYAAAGLPSDAEIVAATSGLELAQCDSLPTRLVLALSASAVLKEQAADRLREATTELAKGESAKHSLKESKEALGKAEAAYAKSKKPADKEALEEARAEARKAQRGFEAYLDQMSDGGYGHQLKAVDKAQQALDACKAKACVTQVRQGLEDALFAAQDRLANIEDLFLGSGAKSRQARAAVLKSYIELLDTLTKGLTSVDEKGSSMLGRLALLDDFVLRLEDPRTYVLSVRTMKSGGSNMTKRNLFFGSRLYHNGGSTGGFSLVEARSGALTSSGTFSAVTNYMREKTFKQKYAIEK